VINLEAIRDVFALAARTKGACADVRLPGHIA
jgi:hypothetical protein